MPVSQDVKVWSFLTFLTGNRRKSEKSKTPLLEAVPGFPLNFGISMFSDSKKPFGIRFSKFSLDCCGLDKQGKNMAASAKASRAASPARGPPSSAGPQASVLRGLL